MFFNFHHGFACWEYAYFIDEEIRVHMKLQIISCEPRCWGALAKWTWPLPVRLHCFPWEIRSYHVVFLTQWRFSSLGSSCGWAVAGGRDASYEAPGLARSPPALELDGGQTLPHPPALPLPHSQYREAADTLVGTNCWGRQTEENHPCEKRAPNSTENWYLGSKMELVEQRL